MSNPVLSLRGIAKTYNRGKRNEVRVLENLDLEIQPGETVGLLAPSGAGKTTLLFVAGLIDSADRGEVRIMGTTMQAASDRRRTRVRREAIGIVYQFHHLLPEFSAIENVMLPQLAGGVQRRKAIDRAEVLLKDVGLGGRLDHRPAELSGGEQQRVALCRALANSPRIVLADEPTGNLDPDTAQQVFDLILEKARQTNSSALIATHNLKLAMQMDRIVQLDHGRIVQAAINQ